VREVSRVELAAPNVRSLVWVEQSGRFAVTDSERIEVIQLG